MTKIAYQFNNGIDVSKQKLDVSFFDKKIAVFDKTPPMVQTAYKISDNQFTDQMNLAII